MILDVYRSLSGDCVLLTSSDGKRILCDGGMPEAYRDFTSGPLGKLRDDGHHIDVAYVSHIDRDHIGGILSMLDCEVEWRAWEVRQKNGIKSKKPKTARPPAVKEIWHNAFLETVAKSNKKGLGAAALSSALGSSATVLAALNIAGMATPDEREALESTRMLAQSVGDALEVNWRISDKQLNIPLNPAYDGEFMVARKDPLSVGSLSVKVVAPTAKELKKLRAEWNAWLDDHEAYTEELRKNHAKDEKNLSSNLSAQDRAIAARKIAVAAKDDVTPPNVASLVLLIEDAGISMLMTGDANEADMMIYLEEAGLGDKTQPLELDVLKVPHHGAHNAYSPEFLDCVHACHYVFCGDGAHHNPEHDVVEGYIEHCLSRGKPTKGKRFQFWFNCSSKLCEPAWLNHWLELENMFAPNDVKAVIDVHFLTKDGSHRISL